MGSKKQSDLTAGSQLATPASDHLLNWSCKIVAEFGHELYLFLEI